MRTNHNSALVARLRQAAILPFFALVACTSEPIKEPEPPPPLVEVQEPEQPQQISLALPDSEYTAQFQRADQLLTANRWMAASEVVSSIPEDKISKTDQVYLAYLQARIDYTRGLLDQALTQLNTLNYDGVNAGQLYRILNLKRHILQQRGDYLESGRLGDEILKLASSANLDQAAIKRQIWRDLQRVGPAQLEQAATSTIDLQWQTWLELAILTRAPLLEQLQTLPVWLNTHSDHPAANPLPGGLGYLLDAPQTLQTVALVLPLSGRLAPAGKAVRDGFLASYYRSITSGGENYDIVVLDQDSYGSASAAYNAALSKGANMVVGPLSKEAVAELANRPDRSIPVLALNKLDTAEPIVQASSAMVQFALAPEDEAKQVAELAFGQGARRALVIRPQGEWGSKVSQALFDQWQSLGGTVVNSVSYSGRENYSDSVKNALGIPASEERAAAVKDALGTDIEFNARRRQDIDAVFLLSASASEARSLKPLLAFHYAGSVPVYAISSVYDGVPDARDRDLDGIHFVETPWLLGADTELKSALEDAESHSGLYTRLNALGADAFLVQTQFRQLQAGADALLRGNTGILSMNPQLQIQRELVPATFDKGEIQAQ
ncbi:MAG: penicillin-binding protein activator [Pseudomonadota bacterium]